MTADLPGPPPTAAPDVAAPSATGVAPEGAVPDGAPDAGWHRLHPLSPIVRTGRHVFALGVLLVLLVTASRSGNRTDLITDSVIVGVALIGNLISWLVTRWQVSGGVLRVETGLLRRQSRRFPLSQVQAIDVVQTGVARVFGLAELRLRMAASGAGEGRLACLTVAHAEALRRQLLELGQREASAMAAPPGTAAGGAVDAPERDGSRPGPAWVTTVPAAPPPAAGFPPYGAPESGAPADGGRAAGPPAYGTAASSSGYGAAAPSYGAAASAYGPSGERVLFRVHTGRLVGGIVLSEFGLNSLAAIGLLVGLSVARVGSGITSIAVVWLVSIALRVWRRFNGGYETEVAAAPDGLRIRSGLVQTTAETIRAGRVQGVVLVEPLLWRWFGWCRLLVDVAGPRERKENRSEAGRLRAVVPVGTRAEAEPLLATLVPGRPVADHRPPCGARWKAPLSYHFLAAGGDDRYVVATRGRLRRTTTWVPLDKVQSIRTVQGPWQRRLGLGTVALDTAGRRVRATLEDRSETEVAQLMAALPDQARAARVRAGARPLVG